MNKSVMPIHVRQYLKYKIHHGIQVHVQCLSSTPSAVSSQSSETKEMLSFQLDNRRVLKMIDSKRNSSHIPL